MRLKDLDTIWTRQTNSLKQEDARIQYFIKAIPMDLQPATSNYEYPLLIRQLLHHPLQQTPDHEIVYASTQRYDYATFARRVERLARVLTELGIEPGNTVAVMDWDSHRYLECFFAVPMMGTVLHTINIRLSPEQILYTVNHAEDDVILVHRDFMPIVEQIRPRFDKNISIVPLDEYEERLDSADAGFAFTDFDENTRATTFYTTGTTGLPKGVYFTHRQLVLHSMGFLSTLGWSASGGTGLYR